MGSALLSLLALGCDSAPPSRSAPAQAAPQEDWAGVIGGAVAIVAHDASCSPAPPALVCTGTLIEPDIVLTAAHCLGDDPPASFDVVIGPTLEGARTRVRAGAKHPAFERATFSHDIAVLVLARSASITPIPLRREAWSAASASFDAIGYGDAQGSPAGVVRQRRRVVRLDAIEDRRLKLLPITSMTCRGDSGGPVLAREGDRIFVVGVTTHGDPACREIGFAARVDRYLEFIDAQVAAARAPAPPRRAFDPSEDLCRAACARDDDCPAGLACNMDERRCSFEGLPPARFGASCKAECEGEVPCIRLSDSECRCLDPCAAPEGSGPGARPAAPGRSSGGGCSTGRGGAGETWLAVMGVALVAARRRRSR